MNTPDYYLFSETVSDSKDGVKRVRKLLDAAGDNRGCHSRKGTTLSVWFRDDRDRVAWCQATGVPVEEVTRVSGRDLGRLIA